MRIVYLNPSGQLGGAETSLRELLGSVRAVAPDWDLWLVLGEDGPLAADARAHGVQVKIAPFPLALARLGDARKRTWMVLASVLRGAPAIWRYKRNLARTVASLRPDIVHTNGFKMHLLGAWTLPRHIPLVWHIHDYVGGRPLMSRLLRFFYPACAVAIVNSRSVADDLRALAPGLKIRPIYNAVDLDRFSPTGSKLDLDAAAGLPPASPGTVRVGLVATFARWKGHKVFLQALARLSPDVPIRGYIVGGPIYQTAGSQWSKLELEQEANRLRLGNRVGFTGHLDNVAAAMRSLDIVVHASTEPEPFGMVIIEAMACGKPVIASRAGGAAELFVEGDEALAHAPGDAGALGEQIMRLASDPALRQTLGQAGRSRAEQVYRRERLAKDLLAVYGDISGAQLSQEGPLNPSPVPVINE